ncbi:MFS transporter [Pectobacterium aroidearum]|uniref:MFS transporter n=1 Tax=Pectobacterium aroidearum TaxID=1201031 RepID=A0ABR5ZA68_9GAMM|nr:MULTISPECIES: MFS transporter [Pectobacterium]MBA5198676.1 MFS transporter [Pectobacterium aroidearum]MBA5226820.1 MFS transporter [Pectobacterium aroidearum]MBA5231468.1 MFS transporter [Pectobacterium aroidearum]MBA5736614.1 MFS transporter [Pectobacterium aroidearum]UXJ98682.1 MFS transporter [Pectobacterium aroidearum]
MNSNYRASALPAPAVNSPPWLGLSVLLIAGFVTIFDLFVVNVAIPSMQADLGASFAQIGFIVAGYELAFGVLLITGGRLGDVFGRRRLFVVGMAGFTLASALCGLAPSAGFLIGARILQGLAAALLFPQVYASIRVNFDGDDSRRAFGLLGMTLGLAAIAGQILGGWLVHANLFGLGWRSIFLINVPIGLLAIVAARFIPESRTPQRPSLDWMGVALVSVGLTLLLVPLIEGPGQGWPEWSLWMLATATLLLAMFYRQQERRQRAGHLPLVDMCLLVQRRFLLGVLLVLLVYSTSSSFFLCFALLVQTGLGLDPFLAGSIFAPCSVGFVLASLAAPRLVARWGTVAIVVGALVYAVSIGLLIMQVQLAGADLVAVRLIPVLVVVGAGQGFIMTPLLNLVLGFVDEAQAGMASGVISTVQQVGAALGVAVVGILFGTALATGDGAVAQAGQYVSAFVAGMLYNLIAALLVCILLLMLVRTQRSFG